MKNNDNYYKALAVMDRIDEEVKKRGSKRQFSLSMGRCGVWWDTSLEKGQVFKPRIINEVAQKLDVCVEYLLTGKNKSNYKPVVVDYSKMMAAYKEKAHKNIHSLSGHLNRNLAPIICYMRKRQNDIMLKTVFDLADELEMNPADVAFAEEK